MQVCQQVIEYEGNIVDCKFKPFAAAQDDSLLVGFGRFRLFFALVFRVVHRERGRQVGTYRPRLGYCTVIVQGAAHVRSYEFIICE
jgi:hypothetical protein